MPSRSTVTQLRPTTVTYKGYTITLKHRPKINDWTYTVTYNIPLRLSDHSPRYDTALNQAKAEIDALVSRS